MKKTILAIALSTIASASYANDPIMGTWKTAPDENGYFGHIDVAPCGDKICGTLVESFDPEGRSVKTKNSGRKLMWDMSAESDGLYGGGRVYSPARAKEYKGKAILSGNKLEIQGCVVGVCRTGSVWTRL